MKIEYIFDNSNYYQLFKDYYQASTFINSRKKRKYNHNTLKSNIITSIEYLLIFFILSLAPFNNVLFFKIIRYFCLCCFILLFLVILLYFIYYKYFRKIYNFNNGTLTINKKNLVDNVNGISVSFRIADVDTIYISKFFIFIMHTNGKNSLYFPRDILNDIINYMEDNCLNIKFNYLEK